MSDARIFLYGLSTCPWCRKTKTFLTEAGVEWDYVDIDLLPEAEGDAAAEEAHRLSGSWAFPVLVVGEHAVAGHNPGRFEALIKQLEAER